MSEFGIAKPALAARLEKAQEFVYVWVITYIKSQHLLVLMDELTLGQKCRAIDNKPVHCRKYRTLHLQFKPAMASFNHTDIGEANEPFKALLPRLTPL